MKQHLIEAYMRGFRAGVAGVQEPPRYADNGAYAHGYSAGQRAVLMAIHYANQHADAVLASPAMAQARANAESACGICGGKITDRGIGCTPGCAAHFAGRAPT
jgi:hypothetical protein